MTWGLSEETWGLLAWGEDWTAANSLTIGYGFSFSLVGVGGSDSSLEFNHPQFEFSGVSGGNLAFEYLPSINLQSLEVSSGELSILHPLFKVDFYSYQRTNGELIFSHPQMVFDFHGADNPKGQLNISYSLSVLLEAAAITRNALVFDIKTLAGPFRFSNYNFDSIVMHNNSLYLANSSGLYKVEGIADSGTAIDAYFEVSEDDMGSSDLKRIVDIYVGIQGGPLSIQTFHDNTYSPIQSLARDSIIREYPNGSFPAITNWAPTRILEHSNGKLYIAGYRGANLPTIACLNSDGSLDSTFGTDGFVTFPSVTVGQAFGIAEQDDGKIVCSTISGAYFLGDLVICRFTPNGVLDTSFGTSGVWIDNTNHFKQGIEVLTYSDNSIIILCTTRNIITFNEFGTAIKLTEAGILDTTWGTNGYLIYQEPAYAVENWKDAKILSDNSVIVCGVITDLDYLAARGIIRKINSAGSFAAGFTTTPYSAGLAITAFYSMAIQGDGKIVVTGENVINDWVTGEKGIVVRWNSDGTLDQTFASSGLYLKETAGWSIWGTSLTISDNRIIVCFDRWNSPTFDYGYTDILALDSSGVLDSSFMQTSFSSSRAGYVGTSSADLIVQQDNKILVVGSSTDADINILTWLMQLKPNSDFVTRRAKQPRGLKHRYWGVKVANVSGAAATIDKIELYPMVLSRKLRQ